VAACRRELVVRLRGLGSGNEIRNGTGAVDRMGRVRQIVPNNYSFFVYI
jgi:hypothetical protein